MTAAEVFISLRSKSILHLIASIGSFLGLEVYNAPFSSPYLKKFNGSNYAFLRKMFLFISDAQREGSLEFRKCLMSLFFGIICRRVRGCLLINVLS